MSNIQSHLVYIIDKNGGVPIQREVIFPEELGQLHAINISRPELIHDGNDVVSLGIYADQLEVELLQYQIELHLFREFLVQEITRMKEKGEEVRLFQERIDQIDRCLRRES